jgi:hypothetical protein
VGRIQMSWANDSTHFFPSCSWLVGLHLHKKKLSLANPSYKTMVVFYVIQA